MSALPGGRSMAMIDRQARDLPLDAHLHTDLSHDSAVPLDDYARLAVERGIAEIAITDHVDFAPSAPGYGETTFEQRERIVREAAERWAERGVAIRFGVEITWDSRYATEIRDHLARHAYDFVIGSVHIYRDSPYAADHVAGWVAGRSLAEIVAPYFDEVAAGARTGLFDAMGHIDFVKRYLAPHVTTADLAARPGAVRADPGRARGERHGPGDQHQRAALAGRGDVPLAGDRGALPRDRRSRRDGRLGCAHGRLVRVGPRGRLRVRGRGRILVACLPSRRRARRASSLTGRA